MLNPDYFGTFYGNEGVRTVKELEKVMKDKAEVFLQSERKERSKKSLPFIKQAYDAFIDSTELDEDDDSFNISKTKDSFNFTYKRSVWEDLGEWAIVKVNVTSNSIKWKQMDEDGKLISNEMKLSGSNEDKIEQLEDWIAREWWGEN